MLLKCYNRALVDDREKTYLTATVAVAGVTLTVQAVNMDVGAGSLWSDNTYLILGEIGSPTAEILQINGAMADGTTLTIDQSGAGGCRFAHSVDEPVYRIDFNQVEFSRNTTDTSTGTTVLVTQLIQPDEEYTRYEDTTNSTGYGFVRFYNATTTAFSSYSDGVNYTASGDSSSYDPRTLWRLRRRIRTLLDEESPSSKLTDDTIRDAVNDKQRDIAHQRLWSFYEYERSFSAVANQFAYDIPATVQKIYNATFRTQPLIPINYDAWKMYHWNTDSSVSIPTNFCIWNRQLLLLPRPSGAAATTTIDSNITATVATIPIGSTSSFRRGDYYRFIIDSEVIYATNATKVSTTLTADVALVDVTISVSDTTDFAAAGTIVIDDDVITYTGKTATSFTGCAAITAVHTSGETVSFSTFAGCLRGQEGTTAATHTAATTVTERDIVFTTHVEPTDLMDTQDRTSIPEVDVIAYGAAIDLAPLVEKMELVDRFERKYTTKLKELEGKYALKQTAHFSVIKEAEARMQDAVIRNPNLYPSGITGT